MVAGFDPAYIAAGFVVGALVGQTGVGGGALTTPLLVLVFGVHPATAVGTDLLYAALTKAVGSLVHGLNRTVDWRVVGRLAAGSLPASALTLLGMAWLPSGGGARAIAVVLGLMLLLTAMALVFRRYILALAGTGGEARPPRSTAAMTVSVGAVLGVLVTMSSVGAGALGVTALLLLYPGARLAVLVGSDIAHAVPLTLIGGLGHWWLGTVDGVLLAALLCGSIPGVALGSHAAGRIPEAVSRPVLAGVLALVGGRLLF